MSYIKRIPTILAGMVFLLSGLGKIGSIIDFQYLIVEYGLNSLNVFAPFIVILEILIGTLLIFNMYSKYVSIGAIILLCFFTLTFTYANTINGINECGCFGNLPIASTPKIVYARNFVLCILLVLAMIYGNTKSKPDKWKSITLGTIIIASSFVAGMTYKPFAFTRKVHPYEHKNINDTPIAEYKKSSQGESELIFFITYSCPHCINSIENYKAWEKSSSVDKTTLYIAIDSTNIQIDSLRLLFKQRFPSIHALEISKETIPFIEAFPTSFIIKSDSIQYIIVGELPSHYLF